MLRLIQLLFIDNSGKWKCYVYIRTIHNFSLLGHNGCQSCETFFFFETFSCGCHELVFYILNLPALFNNLEFRRKDSFSSMTISLCTFTAILVLFQPLLYSSPICSTILDSRTCVTSRAPVVLIAPYRHAMQFIPSKYSCNYYACKLVAVSYCNLAWVWSLYKSLSHLSWTRNCRRKELFCIWILWNSLFLISQKHRPFTKS